MAAFFAGGGRMIDSSPMYGSSQSVIGNGLERLGRPETLFSAEKVWTSAAANGPAQIEQSRRLWGVERFDLLQVHNLRTWEAHLETLFAMKAAGQLRYVGITTSEGAGTTSSNRSCGAIRSISCSSPTMSSIASRNSARCRSPPSAASPSSSTGRSSRARSRGASTANLFPNGRDEIGATSWAQLILKFILSHPAVTVAIPATTRVDHVRENLAAAGGTLPDRDLRERIAAHVGTL